MLSEQAGGVGTRLAYDEEIGADLWWAGRAPAFFQVDWLVT
jgi:hypothetical protein